MAWTIEREVSISLSERSKKNAAQTVTQILQSQHHIRALPGQKGECPFCHGDKFQVKKDDTLGKCFSPSCGQYLTRQYNEISLSFSINRVLKQIYNTWHQSLLKADNEALRYLKERKIAQQVIEDSFLGRAVEDEEYIRATFNTEIARLRDMSPEEEDGKKPRKGNENPADVAVELAKALETLLTLLKDRDGELVFFYHDDQHRMTGFKLRKPFQRQFTTYKPLPRMGVFNASLYPSPEQRFNREDTLIIAEGEFNILQLQTMMLGWRRGNRDGYVYACAVGGVNSADLGTIGGLTKRPLVCYDNDENQGKELVTALQARFSIHAMTTPNAKDLDEWILKFDGNHQAAHTQLKQLIAASRSHLRPLASVKASLDALRLNESLKKLQMEREVAAEIIDDIQRRGRFFKASGSRAYFLVEETKQVIAIDAEDLDYRLWMHAYGVMPSETVFTAVFHHLFHEAHLNGEETEVYLHAHYVAERDTLYVFDLESDVYRISADRDVPEIVSNGTDGVLFQRNGRNEKVVVDLNQPRDRSSNRFWQLCIQSNNFESGRLTKEDRQIILYYWFMSSFFGSILPTRPIVAMIGEQGSGKTSCLRRIGQTWYGKNFDVTALSDDEKDMDLNLTKHAFIALDNVDSGREWLEDKLALAATGGFIRRRTLFTNDKIEEYPIRSFIGITSRTPHFKREDVSSRLLVFGMRSLLENPDGFKSENDLRAQLAEERQTMCTEILWNLHDIVVALKEHKQQEYQTRFRMADFAMFCLRVAAKGDLLEDMERILEAMRNEQQGFALDGDPLVEMLLQWSLTGVNRTRTIEVSELMQELDNLASIHGYEWVWRGKVRSFYQRMRNLKNTMTDLVSVQELRNAGRRHMFSVVPVEKAEEEAVAV